MCCINGRIDVELPAKSSLSKVSGSSGCLKCGTSKKSGKLSCCVRGGAWFKRCGDAGDAQFDHTWSEGMQACKGSATSIPIDISSQVMLRDVAVTLYPLHAANTVQPRNTAHQHMQNIDRPGSMLNAGTAHSIDYVYVGFIKVVVFILHQYFVHHSELVDIGIS